MAYQTVVADPPWPYKNPGEFSKGETPVARGAGSVARYGAMSIEDLKALNPPVADNAHLYLWTTNTFICEAHEIAKAWGFRPITLLTWVKTTHKEVCEHGNPGVSPRTGYYFRGATEHCLFGVRGSLPLRGVEDASRPDGSEVLVLPTAFLWPRRPHSVKPDAFYDLVERCSPGPRLELFARRNRLGWDTWGNQALEHVVMGENEVAEL